MAGIADMLTALTDGMTMTTNPSSSIARAEPLYGLSNALWHNEACMTPYVEVSYLASDGSGYDVRDISVDGWSS